MARALLVHTYKDIISVENLLSAWKEFERDKRKKKDVQEFSLELMRNILSLNRELETKAYRHGRYIAFSINDPKPRSIHKALVRDRLLHHALYRKLYPFFDRTFISDSFSCRLGKGTHRAMARFKSFGGKVGVNGTRTCWVLKCDVRKFFASIDHGALMEILKSHIPDQDILNLLHEIIESFSSTRPGVGLPLGNLTSQLLVNIYMNEFDQFAKHRLKARHYIRYADDFVVLSRDRAHLEGLVLQISNFLKEKLKLSLHPDKVFIKTLASGVDFLGWVHFTDHRVMRTATKNRMFRNIQDKGGKPEVVQSYLGMLSHGNSRSLSEAVRGLIRDDTSRS